MATKVKKNTSKPRATAKTKAASRKGSTARPTKKPAQRQPQGLTDQQRLDAIGLGLMAAAVFFAFVFYFGWEGGKLGNGLATGMEYLIGQGAYLVPLGLAAAGFVAILRSVLPENAFRWPAVTMLCAGILMALSAGVFGLGGSVPVKHVVFDPD